LSVFIQKIEEKDLPVLYELYKNVFSGYPWYEDLACSNCKALYTKKKIKEDSKDRVTELKNFTSCLKCNKSLELVSYYPDVVDQMKLIDEAVNLNGFIGYIALINNDLAGFSWGYKVPDKRTISVNFPEIIPALTVQGICQEKAFYGAETGVIEKYQGIGLGRKLVSRRAKEAFKQGYKTFLNRTINSKMRKILQSLFSGIEPAVLFKDPETKSQWFSYDFKDYNGDASK